MPPIYLDKNYKNRKVYNSHTKDFKNGTWYLLP